LVVTGKKADIHNKNYEMAMRKNLAQLVPSAAADREGDAPINRGRAFHLTSKKQIIKR